jgi:hypothetical protein
VYTNREQQSADRCDSSSLTALLPDPGRSGNSEDARAIESVALLERSKELEAENLRLQTLVGYLLHKNEQLRNRELFDKTHTADASIFTLVKTENIRAINEF